MKITSLKIACIVTLSIAALANAPASVADSYPANNLGAGNVNLQPTDVYGLTCPIGTATVRARVTNPNGSGADEISVQIINPNGRVRTVISLEGISPPTAILSGASGNYLITVHKTPTSFVVPYSIALDCYNGNGVAFSGNQSALIQNQ